MQSCDMLSRTPKGLMPTWNWRKKEGDYQKTPWLHSVIPGAVAAPLTPVRLLLPQPPLKGDRTKLPASLCTPQQVFTEGVAQLGSCGSAAMAWQAEVLAASWLALKFPLLGAIVSLSFLLCVTHSNLK